MAMISFFTAFVGVLALQGGNAQVTGSLPYDLSAYSNLLSAAPYHTACEVPWMGFFEVSIYQQMSILAQQFGMRPDIIAQWYTLVQGICPSYTDMSLYEGLGSIFRSEMLAKNIPFMPPGLPCNPLAQTTPYSPPAAIDPTAGPYSNPYDYSYRNVYAMLDRSVPRLSYSNYAEITAMLNRYLPSACLPQNPLLANRIGTNMRYSLGLASQMTSGINYPFY